MRWAEYHLLVWQLGMLLCTYCTVLFLKNIILEPPMWTFSTQVVNQVIFKKTYLIVDMDNIRVISLFSCVLTILRLKVFIFYFCV